MWQAPSRAYGVITEYQVSFFRQDVNDSVIVSKRGYELFHLVNAMDLPSGEGDILIMVCEFEFNILLHTLGTSEKCYAES